MKMIKFGLIAVLFLAATQLLTAQPRPGGNRGGERPPHSAIEQRVEQLKQLLDLTTEQKTQLDEVIKTTKEKLAALRGQNFASPEQRKAATQAIMKEAQTAIDAILTDEQKAKLEELKVARKERQAERRDSMQEMRAALEAYREENIQPVLLRQRAKLEQKITAEDKATIAELRTFTKARKEEHKANRTERTTRPNRGERERNAERPEEMQKLKTLVEKYKGDIEALMDEIADERKQWEEDLKAIRVAYLGERPEREGENPRGGRNGDNYRGSHHPNGERGEHHKGHIGAAHFLLLDPNGNKPQIANGNQTLNTITSFPNPAANMTTVKYEVKQAGRIRIDIQDESGNIVRTLVNETLSEGVYTIDVNVNNLSNRTYYFVLTDSKGKVTQKTVVTKQ